MRYTIDNVTFPIPDAWRDSTPYMFASPDEQWWLVLELIPEARDEASALAIAWRHYESLWRSMITYSNEVVLPRGSGAPVPAVEGGQRGDGHTLQRFALASFASGKRKAVLRSMGPSSAEFMAFFRKLVERIVFVDEPVAASVPDGMARRQANFVFLTLPRDWRAPRGLLFLDEESDSVAIRVTLDEPKVPEGTIDLGLELADEAHVAGSRTERVRELTVTGWTGEWLVTGTREPKDYLVHKLCVELPGGVVVTAYGKAPTALADRLMAAWAPLSAAIVGPQTRQR